MAPSSSRPSTPKRALAAIAAAALFITVLATTPATHAQQNQPPIADAGDDVVYAVGPNVRTLSANRSFDIEDGGVGSLTYRWEVATASYFWLTVTPTGSPSGIQANFIGPSQNEVNRFGDTIVFRLTVTDSQGATGTDTVSIRFEGAPTAAIVVTAGLLNPDATDTDGDGFIEDEERYTINAVLGRPGQGGNSNNEWDVKEGSRLTLRGIGSTASGGTNDRTLRYRWQKQSAVPNRADFNIPGSQINSQSFSIILPGNFESNRGAILHYNLIVTSASGLQTLKTVRINVVDQPQTPDVSLRLADTLQRVQDANALDPEAATLRYVVTPGTSVQLIATATDGDAGQARTLTYAWSGSGVTPASSQARGTLSRATFTAPSTAIQGQAFTVTVTATDTSNRVGRDQIVFVVANNNPPVATAPLDQVAEDGPRGDTGNQGDVVLTGTGTDRDGDLLAYRWVQVDSEDVPLKRPTVTLMNANTDTVSFTPPRLGARDVREIHLAFTVIDQWGVGDTDTVTVTVLGRNQRPIADAGPNQVVGPGARVSLDGTESSDPNINAVLRWSWKYTSLTTVPTFRQRPPDAFDRRALSGFMPGGNDYTDYSGLNPLTGAMFSRPYFDAPNLGGYTSISLTFELTVTDFSGASDIDTVTITVTGRFFSGIVNGPDFCTNLSLGGARTYAFDSDRDGVADICSLPTTRREAVARQNALETLASLHLATFRARVQEACASLTGNFGDSPADLANDACATRRVVGPPPPVDPAVATQFFSGVISGPDFCTNLSLGGARTYAFDSDRDGVADTCSLPTTRREAVARQNALESFTTPASEFDNALALACRELAGTTFAGDSAADLANDACP